MKAGAVAAPALVLSGLAWPGPGTGMRTPCKHFHSKQALLMAVLDGMPEALL